MSAFLLDEVLSLDAYRSAEGGQGMDQALRLGPSDVVATIRRSGLRGRGGAGFPTGIKWQGLLRDEAARRYVVCNAAEGEPGTFKDRWLLRRNPYQVLEGLAIAANTLSAERAFVGIKRTYAAEIARLETAATEMANAGLLGDVPIDIVEGPDDYLLGEEKALLEVIEGKEPLPRLYPPYVQGLFGDGDVDNPAVVNNVETLANVPHILRHGSGWFRSLGTEESPGTMVFTISGDVRTEAIAELEMGTPLSFLMYGVGEGLAAGRRAVAVWPGASNSPIPSHQLDVPLSFEAMAASGSGLGSGGFIVSDDRNCVVRVAAGLSRFLWSGSCGQCPPCKLGTEAITSRLERLEAGLASEELVDEIAAWARGVTDANRCGLGAGAQNLVVGLLGLFSADLLVHVGAGCPTPGESRLPQLVDYLPDAGRFVYGDADAQNLPG